MENKVEVKEERQTATHASVRWARTMVEAQPKQGILWTFDFSIFFLGSSLFCLRQTKPETKTFRKVHVCSKIIWCLLCDIGCNFNAFIMWWKFYFIRKALTSCHLIITDTLCVYSTSDSIHKDAIGITRICSGFLTEHVMPVRQQLLFYSVCKREVTMNHPRTGFRIDLQVDEHPTLNPSRLPAHSATRAVHSVSFIICVTREHLWSVAALPVVCSHCSAASCKFVISISRSHATCVCVFWGYGSFMRQIQVTQSSKTEQNYQKFCSELGNLSCTLQREAQLLYGAVKLRLVCAGVVLSQHMPKFWWAGTESSQSGHSFVHHHLWLSFSFRALVQNGWCGWWAFVCLCGRSKRQMLVRFEREFTSQLLRWQDIPGFGGGGDSMWTQLSFFVWHFLVWNEGIIHTCDWSISCTANFFPKRLVGFVILCSPRGSNECKSYLLLEIFRASIFWRIAPLVAEIEFVAEARLKKTDILKHWKIGGPPRMDTAAKSVFVRQ